MELAIESGIRKFNAELDHTLRVERAAFATKLRVARAVLGLSQDQFAQHIGLTQKSVHRIEQEAVQPHLRTVLKIEQFLRHQGISFEALRDGGFQLVIDSTVLLRD